jgi:Domain of unknown function (DUF4268)
MTSKLGKLKKVALREGWRHEALDFTQWLAEEENLNLLGDEIGFEIKLLQTEAKVGSFNVDILAEEENTGRKIIIENQLEKTDHDHLGKIITYASGYDAQIVVWVVKEAREEHRQSIDWLNEHTDESIEFYLIHIELYQIGDSPYAPKFEIISKPNDWTKAVRNSVENKQPSDTKIKQLEFWTQFKEYAKEKHVKIRLQKSYPQHWTNISIGSSNAHIALTIHSRENKFGVELYIPKDKELFEKLCFQKEEIEKELGEKAIWMPLPYKKASRIRILHSGSFEDTDNWRDSFEWLISEAEKFHKIFPKYLRTED